MIDFTQGLFLDGGMGTQLQARGLKPGEIPEMWNITHPDDVRAIHHDYFKAGANIVITNTFGANPVKYHGEVPFKDIIAQGVTLAREAAFGADNHWVALDVGPTGRLLKPVGDFDFNRAYDAFAETISLGAKEGAQAIAIETMSDARELKAAVLAAKENAALPILATVALDEGGKLLTGASIACVAALLEGLKVDALGFNCGLGPDHLLPYVKELAACTKLPIIVKPNAGMPQIEKGETHFSVTPENFALHVTRLVKAGASIVGGCCGTTPEHIAAVRTALKGECFPPPRAPITRTTFVTGSTQSATLHFGEGLIIGERINPTGKKRLREALKMGDTAYILREAVSQQEAGAKILDVNVGVPGLDETALLVKTIEDVQSVCDLPLQIDTANSAALKEALRRYNGKPLINSVNGKRESMDAVLPLAAKYGGVVVALTLDEKGIPTTAEGRLNIAKRILEEGCHYGLTAADFVVDVLCMAVSADPLAARVALEALKLVRQELGVHTVLGVSNVSFGLPNRPALNAAMLNLAKEAGLSAAIFNPSAPIISEDSAARNVLQGEDTHCEAWIAHCALESERAPLGTQTSREFSCAALQEAIRRGLKADAQEIVTALLQDTSVEGFSLIDAGIVPALERVGKGFETGKLFLPQLLMAAEAAGAAFEVIRALKKGAVKTARVANPPIILATVKGDIHDIGKNIVRALLENYGFSVIDLGRDVPPEKIVEAAEKSHAKLVGLSALMTTTVGAMAETIRLLNERLPDVKTFVGGAVVTADFAHEIHADFYTHDAMTSVRLAEHFFA